MRRCNFGAEIFISSSFNFNFTSAFAFGYASRSVSMVYWLSYLMLSPRPL